MGSRLDRQSELVRKRIESHAFNSEGGEEYEASSFGGFSDYFRRKKIKLQNLDAETRANSSHPQIFKGIVCHVNGYTQPSLNDLHRMIVQHGGGFLQYLDGKTMCTHIIASNLTPKKKEEFRRYRIVKPAWIVDSVRERRLLPWDAYRAVDEGVGQKVLGFENGNITSQINRNQTGYKEQTDASWYTEHLAIAKPSHVDSLDLALNDKMPRQVVDDDEFSLPDITSSTEEALEHAINYTERAPQQLVSPRNLLEVRTELETPPPSSPTLDEDTTGDPEQWTPAADAAEELHVGELDDFNHDTHTSKQDSEFTAREIKHTSLTPEPDENEMVSHAVIRNSEVLRAISPSRFTNMSAEEHNAILLSDPKIRKSTVVNPEFLEQYYRESRLHHLSTWKADLKSQLQALAADRSSSQRAKDIRAKVKKIPGQRRYIMHVDFDSFFAAVSLKKHPQYRDKPCVVAHGGGSGSEIASCNYPARKYGITNGMWMKRAQALCPELKVLPYDFPAYEDASRRFYSSIMATDGIVQSVSIDEALVDISALCISYGGSNGLGRAEGAVNREQTKADEVAQNLRSEILRETGCNVSVGIGENILLAKVALRKAKPAGQYQLKSEHAMDFIGGLEVRSLPGVAWSIGGKLEEIGMKFVRDIREATKEKLVNTLGPKTGEKLWEYARGIDRTEVGDQVVRKSVSAEVNWGVRFENNEQVDEFMHGLCGELHKRLVKERVKGRQLTLKVMRRAADAPRDPPKHLGHGKCDTFNKSTQLGIATNETEIMAKESIAMLRLFNISPGELRGIGVQMQKLDLIKSGMEGSVAQSSQRKLHFNTTSLHLKPTVSREGQELIMQDPIQDDTTTAAPANVLTTAKGGVGYKGTSIENMNKKPLNTLGTQFILPTQADPSVLAELPEDIRAKLTNRSGLSADYTVKETTADRSEDESPNISRAQSPSIGLPAQSQLDPSILEALPADLREEILGFYKSPSKEKSGQILLPQSPRKTRFIPPSKQTGKRKRGGGLLFGRGRTNHSSSDHQTLTQSNFVARPGGKPFDADGAATTDIEPDEVDEEFLAALPRDIRAEVMDQQRQARLYRTGGIDLSMHQRPHTKKQRAATDGKGPSDRTLLLPSRNPRPTFTSRKLSSLPDLREAISAWHTEFSEEGPYDEDVDVLCKYLQDVVLDEGDMAKVLAVLQWMEWIVGIEHYIGATARNAWEAAVHKLKENVQNAVSDRGLGILEFG